MPVVKFEEYNRLQSILWLLLNLRYCTFFLCIVHDLYIIFLTCFSSISRDLVLQISLISLWLLLHFFGFCSEPPLFFKSLRTGYI